MLRASEANKSTVTRYWRAFAAGGELAVGRVCSGESLILRLSPSRHAPGEAGALTVSDGIVLGLGGRAMSNSHSWNRAARHLITLFMGLCGIYLNCGNRN